MLHCCKRFSFIVKKAGMEPLTDEVEARLARALYCVKDRAKTFGEVIEKGHFILTDRPLDIDEKAAKKPECSIPRYTEIIDAAVAKCYLVARRT